MNSKGYSLIELIVAIAILSIVSIASIGFIVSGVNGYSSVSSNVNLQNRSLITTNFIREYVIDCNEGIYFDGSDDTLYVFTSGENGSDEKEYTAHVFRYDSGTKCLYYGKNTADALGPGVFTCTNSAPDLLAKGVSSFLVALNTERQISSTGAHITYVSSVTVTIDFFVRDKSFKSSENIALRNYPKPVTVNPA